MIPVLYCSPETMIFTVCGGSIFPLIALGGIWAEFAALYISGSFEIWLPFWLSKVCVLDTFYFESLTTSHESRRLALICLRCCYFSSITRSFLKYSYLYSLNLTLLIPLGTALLLLLGSKTISRNGCSGSVGRDSLWLRKWRFFLEPDVIFLVTEAGLICYRWCGFCIFVIRPWLKLIWLYFCSD